MVKIEVFDTFPSKSIAKTDFDTLFLVRFPYRNGVKIVVFELFLSKSIVNAENGVFLTIIFGTIPL